MERGAWIVSKDESIDSAPFSNAHDAEIKARAWAKSEKGCYIRHKENGISKIRLYGEWTIKEICDILNEESYYMSVTCSLRSMRIEPKTEEVIIRYET